MFKSNIPLTKEKNIKHRSLLYNLKKKNKHTNLEVAIDKEDPPEIKKSFNESELNIPVHLECIITSFKNLEAILEGIQIIQKTNL